MTKSPQVQALQERYKNSLSDKAVTIESHLADLRDNWSASENELADTKEMLHKFAGSSGMYGYDDIAELCRVAMDDIDQADLSGLRNHLEQIKLLLEQHA